MRFNPDRGGEAGEAEERARELRRGMSVPEIKLWGWLRGRRVRGAKFRRQHPVGPYWADFYCAEVGLVVELDGRMHEREHDERRDAFMSGLGLSVMRVPVPRFEKNELAVVRAIAWRIDRLRREKAPDPG